MCADVNANSSTDMSRENKPVKRPIDRPSIVMAVALALLVLVEIVGAAHHKPLFPWHSVPGFMAAIGLVACLTVVILSKWLGKAVLQRPEDDDA